MLIDNLKYKFNRSICVSENTLERNISTQINAAIMIILIQLLMIYGTVSTDFSDTVLLERYGSYTQNVELIAEYRDNLDNYRITTIGFLFLFIILTAFGKDFPIIKQPLYILFCFILVYLFSHQQAIINLWRESSDLFFGALIICSAFITMPYLVSIVFHVYSITIFSMILSSHQGATEFSNFTMHLNIMIFVSMSLALSIIRYKDHLSIEYKNSKTQELSKLLKEHAYELSLSNMKLKEKSETDELTQLGNRRKFNDILDKLINDRRYGPTRMAFIILDIDSFKKYNDTYGHDHGDVCLQKISESIRKQIRGNDNAFRHGGEEFSLLLTTVENEDMAYNVAERIRKSIENLNIKHEFNNDFGKVTASVGVCYVEFDPKNVFDSAGFKYQMIKIADKNLYKSKNGGRNMTTISRMFSVNKE